MRGALSTHLTLTVAGLALLADLLIVSAAHLLTDAGPMALRTLMDGALTPGPMAAHVALVAALAAAVLRWRPRFSRAPGVILLGVLMVFLGPLGTAIAFLAALVATVVPAAEVELEGAGRSEMRAGGDGAESGQEVEPQSLADVFRQGTLAQRRQAVALIGANFRPEFAAALRMALADENNAIRVQAGMVMQQLEDQFDRRQAELEAHTEDELARHGFDGGEAWLRLARMHDEQAYTGLLDDKRASRAHAEALRAYRHHLQHRPDDLEVISAIGRLLIRAGQHRVVADWLQEQIAAGRVNDSILMWCAEGLYRQGRYAALQKIIAEHGGRIRRHLPAGSPFHAVLDLWGPGRKTGAKGGAPTQPGGRSGA